MVKKDVFSQMKERAPRKALNLRGWGLLKARFWEPAMFSSIHIDVNDECPSRRDEQDCFKRSEGIKQIERRHMSPSE